MTGVRIARRAALAAACLAVLGTGALAPVADARRPTPIELRHNLRPGLQLAAMRAALHAAPSYFQNYNTGCARVTPMLAAQDGQVMAGNFRDDQQGCYIWLNLEYSPDLNARDICKLTLHEAGHLGGLEHSQDENDVMYSPYRADPVPEPCRKPLAAYVARVRARRAAARRG